MVNIVIKTLKNQKLDLEVQDDDTILDIKKKINEQHKLGPPEAQKLIHRGKILQNDSTVKTIGFKEKDFVVVMVKKAKPKVKTNKTSTQQTTSSTTTSNTNTNTNNNTSNTNTSTTSVPTSSTNTTSNNNNNNDSVKKILDETNNILTVNEMITGPENIAKCVKMLQEKVNEIITPRKVTEEDCKIALRAAYNFPARAGNILLDETQLNIEKVKFQQQREQVQQVQQQQQQQTGNTGNTGGTGNNLPNSNPTGNPLQGLGGGNQLINLIGQLARTNPDLMRAIQNDPQALQRALQDPQLIQQLMSVMILQRMQQESNQGGNQQGQQNTGGLGNLTRPQQGQGQQGGNQPGVIRISQEDQSKIQQVMEFTGCQHRDAAEAYFACDKSVELAVNYVLTEQSNSRLQFQAPQQTTTTTTTTTTQPQQQQQQEPKNDEEKPKESTDDKN